MNLTVATVAWACYLWRLAIVAVMTHLRVSEAAALLGVSTDTVRRTIEAGRLTARSADPGPTMVSGVDVAALAAELHPAPPVGQVGHTSSRNQMRGIVTRIVTDTVMAQVDVQAGPFRLVSLLSAEAVEEMGLEVGSVAVASIKATHVTIGVPT
ncbi:TOBE domain-containing protein [soil metagenome]